MPVSPYTREVLAEAAESSRTLSEALEKLGVDPKSSRRRYLHDRMRKLGVDTSHFEREGARWTKEILEDAVAASSNMCEVLRHLGIEVVGGHHTHISRRVRAFGIDTSHFATPASGVAKRKRSPEELLTVQTSPKARREQSCRLRGALLAFGVTDRCVLCGIEATWQGYPLPLEVDHIDGDWRNNRIENLRLLCPNCHSTTDTYRGRGKARHAVARRASRSSGEGR
ncbi:HNH endonuclease signature motif containing protein [Streptomyces roseoverticillatus]|uniref:HNH endonuclease signature motif containing protein n=1 Tax=Streptomyces roseoverticillatus TaxID=66429 RepID=UPI0004BF158E|nr:HNH endonuclease signature motif containing protein [Streptomyces roseoverticillatus]